MQEVIPLLFTLGEPTDVMLTETPLKSMAAGEGCDEVNDLR